MWPFAFLRFGLEFHDLLRARRPVGRLNRSLETQACLHHTHLRRRTWAHRSRSVSSTLSGLAPMPLKSMLTIAESDGNSGVPCGGTAYKRQHLFPPDQAFVKRNRPPALVMVW